MDAFVIAIMDAYVDMIYIWLHMNALVMNMDAYDGYIWMHMDAPVTSMNALVMNMTAYDGYIWMRP